MIRDEREIVGDEDDRAPPAALLVDHRHQLARVPRILPERRLVEHEHLRTGHERAGHGEPALLAVRERMRVRPRQLREREALEELVRVASLRRRADLCRVGELVAHRGGEEAALRVLEHVCDAARGLGHGDGLTIEHDRAHLRAKRPREHEPERALTRAVRTDDRGGLARAEGDSHAADRGAVRAGIAVAQPFRREGHPPGRGGRRRACPIRPALAHERRRGRHVARNTVGAKRPGELSELRPPHPEPLQARRLLHEHTIDVAVESERAVVAEHRNAVDERGDEIKAVLDEHQRAFAVRAERGVRGEDLARAERIQVRRRLIEDERRRAHGEKGGERDALLGAARQVIEPARGRRP